MTQLQGSARLHSIYEVVSEIEGEELEMHDVISNDREDPSVQAARKMDWDAFMSSLNQIEKVLIESLVKGLGMKEAAQIAKVSVWTMNNYRQKMGSKILEFMGVEILRDIALVPRWKINLDAERESVLCRHERRA